MIETQKIYLGEHPIEVTKFGEHGNLIKQPETLITKGFLPKDKLNPTQIIEDIR